MFLDLGVCVLNMNFTIHPQLKTMEFEKLRIADWPNLKKYTSNYLEFLLG